MNILVATAGVALSTGLLLTGCSADSTGTVEVTGAPAPHTGDSSTSPHLASEATIRVKRGDAWLVGTIVNPGPRPVTVQNVYVNGFKLAEVGKLEDGQVVRPQEGLLIAAGGEIRLGTSGTVARLSVPDGALEQGTELRVNISFDDNSQIIDDVELVSDLPS